MHHLTRSIRTLALAAVLGLLVPGMALATPAEGPSKREALLFGAIALLCLGLTVVLYRLFYGFFLDRHWDVGWAQLVAVGFFLMSAISIGLFIYLRFWPQAWQMAAWIVDAVLWGILMVMAAVGHFRYSA